MKLTKKKRKRILCGILAFIFVIAAGCGIYLSDYYHADETALAVLNQKNSDVTIIEEKNKTISFLPENPKAGFIFYPGGKVEYEAYAPLLNKLAQQDILCVLVHMPGNLAVLDENAADGMIENYPEITDWYIGGHSLGGAMAASYVSKNSSKYKGLVLLAAYSTVDLTESGLSVLSIYGSEDGVLNRESYDADFKNLPSDTIEVVLEGGCHSYFGNYGLQDGDGEPGITREEQMGETVEKVLEMVVGRR